MDKLLNPRTYPNRPFPYSHYNSWESIENYNTKVISKVNNYLSSLNTESLCKQASRRNKEELQQLKKYQSMFLQKGGSSRRDYSYTLAKDIPPPDMGWLSVMKKIDPIWIMK
jgi:hypothetical protein